MRWLVVLGGCGRDCASSYLLPQHLLLSIYRLSTAKKKILPRNHTPQYTESTHSIIPRIIQLFSLSCRRETFSKIHSTKESIPSQRKSWTESRIWETDEWITWAVHWDPRIVSFKSVSDFLTAWIALIAAMLTERLIVTLRFGICACKLRLFLIHIVGAFNVHYFL
jgi:hypothetical protein